MNKQVLYRSSGINKTTPFEIKKLHANDISWDADSDFNNLTIKAIDINESQINFLSSTREPIILGIHLIGGLDEALISNDWEPNAQIAPIKINLEEKGIEFRGERPYFEIYFYGKETKRKYLTTHKIYFIDPEYSTSLLTIMPFQLSQRPYKVDCSEDQGIVLYVSQNFKNSDGIVVPYSRLKDLLVNSPVLGVGIFPFIISEIVRFSIKYKETVWAREWLDFFNVLIPNTFNAADGYSHDGDIDDVIDELSSVFNSKKYADKLFASLNPKNKN